MSSQHWLSLEVAQLIGEELLLFYDDAAEVAAALADLSAWNRTCKIAYDATFNTFWNAVSLPRQYDTTALYSFNKDAVHELHYEAFRTRKRKMYAFGNRTHTLAMKTQFTKAVVLYGYMRTKDLHKIHRLEVRVVGRSQPVSTPTVRCVSTLPTPPSGYMDLNNLTIYMRDETVAVPPLPLTTPTAPFAKPSVMKWHVYFEVVRPIASIPPASFIKQLIDKHLFDTADDGSHRHHHLLSIDIRTADTRPIDDIVADVSEQLRAYTKTDAFKKIRRSFVHIAWRIKLTRLDDAPPLREAENVDERAPAEIALHNALQKAARNIPRSNRVHLSMAIRQRGVDLLTGFHSRR